MHEKHNGLARVAPKGCRIGKRVLTKGGPIRKVDKKGKLKPDKRKFKVRGREFAVHAQMPDGTVEKFIWDTGATESSFNHVVAKKLGLLDADGNPTSKYLHKTVNVGMADKSVHKGTLFRRVPLRLRERGGQRGFQGRCHREKAGIASVRRDAHARRAQVYEGQVCQMSRRSREYGRVQPGTCM